MKATSHAEFVALATNDAEAWARTVDYFGEDSPRVSGWLEYGIPWTSAACATETGLADVADHAGAIDSRANSVWMDNTTLLTADTLLSRGERYMTPLTIWDLISFCRNAVSCEHIYHYQHPSVDDVAMNNRLGDGVLVPLNQPYQDVPPGRELPEQWEGLSAHMCGDFYMGLKNYFRNLREYSGPGTVYGAEMEAIRSAWAAVVDYPSLATGDVLDKDCLERTSWRSPAPTLIRQFAEASDIRDSLFLDHDSPAWKLDPDSSRTLDLMREILTASNVRCYINQRQADLFGLPYAPSIARMPFRAFVHRRRTDVDSAMASLQLADAAYAELAQGQSFRLPVYFAVTLRNAQEPEDLWTSLREHRAKAERYRQRRTSLDEAVDRGDLKELRKLKKALNTDAEKLTEALGHSATGALSGALEVSKGSLPSQATAIAAVAGAVHGLVTSTFASRVIMRFRRPELLYLSNLVDEAKSITRSLSQVARVWGLSELEERRFAERFESVSKLTTL